MNKKCLSIFLIILNSIGIICLVVLGVQLLMQDTTVNNPDAMIPMENWDGAGALLCLGFLPLLAANILGFIFIARGQIRLKYRLLFFLPSFIITLLVIYYLLLSFHVIPGFFPKPAVIKVSLLDHDSRREEDYIVYEGGNYSECPKFESDPVEVYTADYDCFEAYIDDNTVRNRFVRYDLTGSQGQPAPENETFLYLMETAADELEHDLLVFQIIQDGKDCFVFVKLNVNWSDPCDLYRYDPNNDTLIHLCRWQDVDFQGIRVLLEWE